MLALSSYNFFSWSHRPCKSITDSDKRRPLITPRSSSMTSIALHEEPGQGKNGYKIAVEEHTEKRPLASTGGSPIPLPGREGSLEDLLIDACGDGDVKAVRFLLEKKAPINATRPWAGHWDALGLPAACLKNLRLTPLTAACAHGHESVVKALVEAGADVQAADNCAVFVAVVAENPSITSYLLASGARLASAPFNPLAWASRMHNMSLLTVLLANLPPAPQSILTSAALEACAAGHDDVLRLLLKYGVDLKGEVECIRRSVEGAKWRVLRVLLDEVFDPVYDYASVMEHVSEKDGHSDGTQEDRSEHDILSIADEESAVPESPTTAADPNFVAAVPITYPDVSTTLFEAPPFTPTPSRESTDPFTSVHTRVAILPGMSRSFPSTPEFELLWDDVVSDTQIGHEEEYCVI
ncbi:uncharacterized protein SPPG_00364 [Spizellomyces punctatus DAOM BR117]|uniref:Uncharacterized protein n=1 Tax=Spizellomyces punctatus (strain DAOM BR117) TaxID=645134 RepID=A0A0L0HU69_SPIPD|nr:uncharacterized protein SPPG_00364 [Spizellomyces punctatus DAOM BR117]KND04648.1 hypothetical protein SPPG_00364 [Spizellomyces punctatus DAOM BR117]|eukprot:XP_016612687.1 hypothetical protein SPPG_00364 [Spizellomyces punctatus DAOM BR117]